MLRLSRHHNSVIAADDYEAAVLTRQSQHRLELAALDGAHRGGSAAHPQALELPLAGGNRLRLTPHLPHLVGGTAGLQTPGHHAQKQTHNLQAHHHSAQRPRTHLEHLEHLEHPEHPEHLETQMILKQEARAVEFVEFLRALLSVHYDFGLLGTLTHNL